METKRLTPPQREAIRRAAEYFGGRWKAELHICWMKADYPLELADVGGLLQQVRNELGPTWLEMFSLNDPDSTVEEAVDPLTNLIERLEAAEAKIRVLRRSRLALYRRLFSYGEMMTLDQKAWLKEFADACEDNDACNALLDKDRNAGEEG